MMDWDNIAHVRIHARAAEQRIIELEARLASQEATIRQVVEEMRGLFQHFDLHGRIVMPVPTTLGWADTLSALVPSQASSK